MPLSLEVARGRGSSESQMAELVVSVRRACSVQRTLARSRQGEEALEGGLETETRDYKCDWARVRLVPWAVVPSSQASDPACSPVQVGAPLSGPALPVCTSWHRR